MSLIKHGSFALVTAMLAISAGVSINRLVDTPQRWAEGQVVIHESEPLQPAAVSGRLVVKPPRVQ